MNEKLKELTVKLCNELQLKNFEFLVENIKQEESTTSIMNIVVSAHVSSLFNCMMEIARDDKQAIEKVKNFIDSITKHISTFEKIEKIEGGNGNKKH